MRRGQSGIVGVTAAIMLVLIAAVADILSRETTEMECV
jgi:hypothetical protein